MIAITGAAGFIGSNLAHYLAKQEYDLILVDRTLSPLKAENLTGLPTARFLWHDAFLAELTAGTLCPDAIFHLGACSRTTETSWEFLRSNNVGYSQSLWSWCTHYRRPFYYASSAATYGDGSRGFDDQTHPDDLQPLNLYGRSKNDFDRWALSQAEKPPQWGGLKFFNVYGPREAHKERMASVVWQTFRQISETGGMKLFRSNDPNLGDGEQSRDFVFVEDCVEQMVWMWRHAPANGIYNCGAGRSQSFFDLARAVFAAINLPANISFIDMPADISRQYQNFTQAEMHAIRVAGYDRPATMLEDGVANTVEALRRRATAA